MAVFDKNTRFSGHGMFVVLLDPAKTLVSLVLLLSGRQRWTSAEHVPLSISVCLLRFFFYSALSQSVFLERYREDEHVPAQVLTAINREVQSSFMLHSFSDVMRLFPCFLSREGICAFL